MLHARPLHAEGRAQGFNVKCEQMPLRLEVLGDLGYEITITMVVGDVYSCHSIAALHCALTVRFSRASRRETRRQQAGVRRHRIAQAASWLLGPMRSHKVFEHRHCPVGSYLRHSGELDSSREHSMVIAPEVIGAQKQEYPPSSLFADEGLLLWGGGPSQE